jgi:hypothetical protein
MHAFETTTAAQMIETGKNHVARGAAVVTRSRRSR